MKWFKHYQNANTNKLLDALLSHKNGHEYYGMYWLLLEALCTEFAIGKAQTEFTFSQDRMCSILRVKYFKKAQRFLRDLAKISERFDEDLIEIEGISSETPAKILKCRTSIILDLLGKEFKRTRQCRGNDPAKNKDKDKDKDKELDIELTKVSSSTELKKINSRGAVHEFSHDETISEFLADVNKSTQKLWLKTYQDPSWLTTEILKAMAWLEVNPRKRPKGNPARFLGNWFARGFETYRKTIPSSNRNAPRNFAKENQDYLLGEIEKLEQEASGE